MDILLVEYSQLDTQDIFDPRRVKNLSHEEKVEIFHIIAMFKEKRDIFIKARVCVDGRTQYKYISKDEVTCPCSLMEKKVAI